MKNLKVFFASILLTGLTVCISPLPSKAQVHVSVSFQTFYDDLSPYGTWVSSPTYGNVWVPGISVGFRPYYSGGRWVYTDDGWMWASDYDWGWAPFHYGSWAYDSYYGWMWVPGYEWSPAWVTWGYYDGYYGWAPYGPGVAFSTTYYPPVNYWVFCHPRYMNDGGFRNHAYLPNNNRIVINNTSITNVNNITVVNNVHNYNGVQYNAGPKKEAVEKITSRKLEPVAIKEKSAPGKVEVQGREVSVYRPRVDASDKNTAKPAKLVPIENLKKSNAPQTVEQNKRVAPVQNERGKQPVNQLQNRKADLNQQPVAPQRKQEMQQHPQQPEQKTIPQQQLNRKEIQPQNGKPQMQEQRPQMNQPQIEQQRKMEMQRPQQPENRGVPQQQNMNREPVNRPQQMPERKMDIQQQRPQQPERMMPQQQPQMQQPERRMPEQRQPMQQPMPQQRMPVNQPPHNGGRGGKN